MKQLIKTAVFLLALILMSCGGKEEKKKYSMEKIELDEEIPEQHNYNCDREG